MLLLIFSKISGKFPEILNFRKFYNPREKQKLNIADHSSELQSHLVYFRVTT